MCPRDQCTAKVRTFLHGCCQFFSPLHSTITEKSCCGHSSTKQQKVVQLDRETLAALHFCTASIHLQPMEQEVPRGAHPQDFQHSTPPKAFNARLSTHIFSLHCFCCTSLFQVCRRLVCFVCVCGSTRSNLENKDAPGGRGGGGAIVRFRNFCIFFFWIFLQVFHSGAQL